MHSLRTTRPSSCSPRSWWTLPMPPRTSAISTPADGVGGETRRPRDRRPRRPPSSPAPPSSERSTPRDSTYRSRADVRSPPRRCTSARFPSILATSRDDDGRCPPSRIPATRWMRRASSSASAALPARPSAPWTRPMFRSTEARRTSASPPGQGGGGERERLPPTPRRYRRSSPERDRNADRALRKDRRARPRSPPARWWRPTLFQT
mmetsp:Transcript_22136/g.49259  ORF Transcript_22136/g.49259 Transcript_22136/m.49259 type:complete len:207 (+) Transcript_22136:539-1159(+)